ncbi:Poly-(ADP-ribose) polymerase [Carabus blaptoides fortunei]
MELPFITDYAKSSRAICRGCQTKIVKDTLRLAIMLQSTTFDSKVPNWYHSACFFIEHMPQSTDDIENFDSLKWDDKEEIRETINKGESPYSSQENKDQLKRAISMAVSKASIQDYTIGYPKKSSRTKCTHCSEKIIPEEVRVSKKFKKQLWYHLNCFAKIHEDLDYLESGNKLSGFDQLSEKDQINVETLLPGVAEVPKKKQRLSDEHSGQNLLSKKDKKMKEQTNIMHKYREDLKENLNKDELAQLLKHNKQPVPAGKDNMLDRASDMLTFGALSRCPNCYRGTLNYTSTGYKCHGFMGAWVRCSAVIQDPDRIPVEVPLELKLRHTFLYKYEYVKRKRHITATATKSTGESSRITGPLQYKNLVISGFSPNDTEKMTSKVRALGGRVMPDVRRSVLAVISTPIEVEYNGKVMQSARECNVYVVSAEFLDTLGSFSYITVDDAARKHSICSWGAELHNRVPQQFQRNQKSSANRPHKFGVEEEETKRKLCVKGGIAIEPDSGLELVAHVYQSGDVRFNAVLSRTELSTNKNTYYKIQLLEADSGDNYWIYKGWGRIGTSIGSCKVSEISSLNEAKKSFKDLFKEKTGNVWEGRHHFVKKPGKFSYVEVDYQAQKEEIDLNNRVADSSLAPAVAQLMAMIFNVQTMEKVMLEYELDLQKMPLGKVSRTQIIRAYDLLNQISWMIRRKHFQQSDVIEYSNQFYSLMPHNSALERPPLLDNSEIIQKKSEMLASLMELETAFTMIQRSAAGDINPLDSYYKQINAAISPITESSDEYQLIQEYVNNTHADTHSNYNLKILEVFKVQRDSEVSGFEKYKSLHNRRLLWHGSRTTNFAGILSQGLRIAPPEAPVSGYMFGKGIYFADMVSKSANYCYTTATDSEGLLLLCEVALGNMAEKYANEYVTKLPRNVHSVKGIGKTEPDPQSIRILADGTQVPLGKGVTDLEIQSALLYNEYIVYDIAQVKIKYLIKFVTVSCHKSQAARVQRCWRRGLVLTLSLQCYRAVVGSGDEQILARTGTAGSPTGSYFIVIACRFYPFPVPWDGPCQVLITLEMSAVPWRHVVIALYYASLRNCHLPTTTLHPLVLLTQQNNIRVKSGGGDGERLRRSGTDSANYSLPVAGATRSPAAFVRACRSDLCLQRQDPPVLVILNTPRTRTYIDDHHHHLSTLGLFFVHHNGSSSSSSSGNADGGGGGSD